MTPPGIRGKIQIFRRKKNQGSVFIKVVIGSENE